MMVVKKKLVLCIVKHTYILSHSFLAQDKIFQPLRYWSCVPLVKIPIMGIGVMFLRK